MRKIEIILQECEKAFLEEGGRKERLVSKSEKYFSFIAVVIGFRLIELHPQIQLANIQGMSYLIISIISFLLMGISLILSLLSIQVKGYVSYPRGNDLIDNLESEKVSDVEAKKAIAIMYLTARETNACLNDKKARILAFSGILLVIGFLTAVIGYLVGSFTF